LKKGIALFSTLMILVLVIMLMSVALKNSTNIKRSSLKDRYLIQENLTITDAIKLVDTQISGKLKNIGGEDRVRLQTKLFSTPLTIQDTVTNSVITIELDSNDGKININNIKNTDEIKKYILRVLSKVGVKEPMILGEILLANITNSDKYRDDYKLHLKQLDKNPGLIHSYLEFEEMLQLYVQNTYDIEALDIDFNKYFTFYVEVDAKYNRSDEVKIDINYAEIELVEALEIFPSHMRKSIIDKKILYKLEYVEITEENEIMQSIVEKLETNNIILKINTTSINNKVTYTINYNLKTRKISKISMDRWIY
jgi:hypothetical protein